MQENRHIKNEYLYGAINRLEEAWNAKGEVSRYIYNGLRHRVGRETGTCQMPDITKDASWDSLDPVKKLESVIFSPTGRIDYVVDLTKEYHNLLQKCESGHTQTYLWDGNVADTMSGGLFDIGAAIGLAFTNAEDVKGLLGKGSAIGASGGYLGYVTLDALSFDEMEKASMVILMVFNLE